MFQTVQLLLAIGVIETFSIEEYCFKSAVSAILASSRASGTPKQKWIPCPNSDMRIRMAMNIKFMRPF